MRGVSVILAIIILLLLFGLGIYLGWQNRASAALRSKILPALIIGMVGAVSTIYFSLEGEKIERHFSSTLFFHKGDKLPLDRYCKNNNLIGGNQFDIGLCNFLCSRVTGSSDLSKGAIGNPETGYHDIAFLQLLSRFSWVYADWWDVSLNTVRRGDSVQSIVGPVEPVSNISSVELKDLLNGMDENSTFCKLLRGFAEETTMETIKVPPQTAVKFIDSRYSRTLVFRNPFAEVSINIRATGGGLGLGDYRWLLGYDEKMDKEFWGGCMRVTCKANFEQFKSGHPDMPRYHRWVDTMFEEIAYQLDDEQRLKRAKEYRDLVELGDWATSR